MVRKLADNRIGAEGGRRGSASDEDEKRSWLDDIKGAIGLQGRHRRPRKKMPLRARFSLGYFIVALLLMILIQNIFLAETIHRIPYSEFKELLRNGKVESVTLSQDEIRGAVKEGEEAALGGTRLFLTIRVQDPDLVNELEQHGVKYAGRYESTWLTTLLSWVVPILIFFGIWSLIFRRMNPGGTVMTIGRSKAKIYGENEVKVTFNDVAGVQEEIG